MRTRNVALFLWLSWIIAPVPARAGDVTDGPELTTAGPRAEAARLRQREPELARQIDAARATPTRGGALRLVGAPEGRDAAILHLDLALYGGEPESVRAARVRAAVLDLSPAERAGLWTRGSPLVRRAGAAALVQDPAAGPELAAAARADADPVVREIAVATLSRLADGGGFGPVYAAASADVSPTVRALAVRAIGWWGLRAYEGVVREAQADRDPGVRAAARAAAERLAAP